MHTWMLIGAIDVRSRDECRAAMTLVFRPPGSILGQAWAGSILQRVAIHLSYHTRAYAHVYAWTYVGAIDEPALEGGWASLALFVSGLFSFYDSRLTAHDCAFAYHVFLSVPCTSAPLLLHAPLLHFLLSCHCPPTVHLALVYPNSTFLSWHASIVRHTHIYTCMPVRSLELSTCGRATKASCYCLCFPPAGSILPLEL